MLVGRVDVGCYGVRGWSRNVEKYGGGILGYAWGSHTVLSRRREKVVVPPKNQVNIEKVTVQNEILMVKGCWREKALRVLWG